MSKVLTVVLDTNIILSSLLFNSNGLSQFRSLWQQQKFIPLASKATVSELIRVLAYPKFKLSLTAQQDLLAEYLPYVKTTAPIKPANIVCRDVNDLIFLDLAVAGNADYLVTGDQDLLVLNLQLDLPKQTFQIMTPAAFLLMF